MAPTLSPRVPSGDFIHKLSRSVTSSLSKISIRDAASPTTPLASVFALVMSSSSVSRRALTPLSELPRSTTTILTHRSADLLAHSPEAAHLLKRQNAILAIPVTYAGLNSGPSPGAVVGIMLGSIAGFLLILYIFILSLQFYSGSFNSTVVKEEVVVKRRSSRSARRSSHHSSHHQEHISVHNSPPPPRRETEIIVEEEFIRHSSRRPSPSPSPPEEVIVEEEEERTASEEIVEVIEEEEQSISIVSPSSRSSPPRRPPSNRTSQGGFRIVDPELPGGGDAPMRRMSRRSSRRGD